jgi:PiT family inorganic phosphate transporter
MVTSPVVGFLLGLLIMGLLYSIFAPVHPLKVSAIFRRLQIVSAAIMAYAHGSNDAQKSMGIITLALVSFGKIPQAIVPDWVIFTCAGAMALGTAAGGYRIMRTMGHRIVRLEPVHGFAAETSAAVVILSASHLGMPVSTTHVISGSIFGVGVARRFNAVRWGVAQQMVTAWVLTLPAAGAVAALVHLLLTGI